MLQQTVKRIIVTDYGNLPVPPDMLAMLETVKLTKRGDPDRRTKMGRVFNDRVQEIVRTATHV